jgi:hypothetical protein
MADSSVSKIFVLAGTRGFTVLVSETAPTDRRPIVYYEAWGNEKIAADRARELADKPLAAIFKLARNFNPDLCDLAPVIAKSRCG